MTAQITTILDLKTARVKRELLREPSLDHNSFRELESLARLIALKALPAYQHTSNYYRVK